jgi:hypothetical protein
MAHELTDIHNRNKNIRACAELAQRNNTPLLAWPEDTELLKLADLPVINGRINVPSAWSGYEMNRTFFLASDAELRAVLVVGRAYFRNSTVQHIAGNRQLIVELTFKA